MPYIKQERRELVFDKEMCAFNYLELKCAGDLNYALSMFFLNDKFLQLEWADMLKWVWSVCEHTAQQLPDNYQTHNDIMGALTNCNREFERRFSKTHERPDLVHVLIHDTADRWYKEKVAPYEKLKIEENGDII